MWYVCKSPFWLKEDFSTSKINTQDYSDLSHQSGSMIFICTKAEKMCDSKLVW